MTAIEVPFQGTAAATGRVPKPARERSNFLAAHQAVTWPSVDAYPST